MKFHDGLWFGYFLAVVQKTVMKKILCYSFIIAVSVFQHGILIVSAQNYVT